MPDLREALANALRTIGNASSASGRTLTVSHSTERKPGPTLEPIDVRLGLDFGTRWTKVAYTLDDGRSIQHVYKNAAADQPFFPTQLFISPSDDFTVYCQRNIAGQQAVALPYLKLFLRDRSQQYIPLAGRLSDRLTAGSFQALSAYYIAATLRFALDQIRANEKHRLEGRAPRYWLNVSIPADHFHPTEQEIFRSVASVGLAWALSNTYPNDQVALATIEQSYTDGLQAQASIDRERVGVIPEIVAALIVFLSRRDTPNGIHGFIDIGAGTLDGCVFQFRRGTGAAAPEIRILSSRVENLGSAILSLRSICVLQNEVGELVEKPLVTSSYPTKLRTVELPLADLSSELSQFSGFLSAMAFRKQPLPPIDRKVTERHLDRQTEYLFHLAGGAATSQFYVAALEGAYANRCADACGCLPYTCRLTASVIGPDGASDPHFARTLIAAGLTRNADDLNDIGLQLPHEIAEPAQIPVRATTNNYADSKDWT